MNAASVACPAKPALAAKARRFPNEFSSMACSNIVESPLRASRARQAGRPVVLTQTPHCGAKFRHDSKVHLPVEIGQRIEERASEVPFAELKRAAAAMSDAYREGRPFTVFPAAYLVTRMPATYAATYSALRELPEGLPPIETVLDIGAGTAPLRSPRAQCFLKPRSIW